MSLCPESITQCFLRSLFKGCKRGFLTSYVKLADSHTQQTLTNPKHKIAVYSTFREHVWENRWFCEQLVLWEKGATAQRSHTHKQLPAEPQPQRFVALIAFKSTYIHLNNSSKGTGYLIINTGFNLRNSLHYLSEVSITTFFTY